VHTIAYRSLHTIFVWSEPNVYNVVEREGSFSWALVDGAWACGRGFSPTHFIHIFVWWAETIQVTRQSSELTAHALNIRSALIGFRAAKESLLVMRSDIVGMHKAAFLPVICRMATKVASSAIAVVKIRCGFGVRVVSSTSSIPNLPFARKLALSLTN
jgi:hypothetical protein